MDLQYPVGRFEWSGPNSPDDRRRLLNQIEQTPARLRAAVEGLSAEQLDTPYRPDGWTVRQVVHHVPDSHLNSYIRFKLALTEDEPVIKPYEQTRWNLARTARVSSQKVDFVVAIPFCRQLCAQVSSSGARSRHAGHESGIVCVARAAPRGTHHFIARAKGLAVGSLADSSQITGMPIPRRTLADDCRSPALNTAIKCYRLSLRPFLLTPLL